MFPLKTNRKVLTLFSVVPCDESSNVLIKVICLLFPLIVFTGHIWSIAASAIYFANNIENDMDTAFFAILQIGGHFNMAYMLIIAIYLRTNINNIFNKLDVIYKTRKRCLNEEKKKLDQRES